MLPYHYCARLLQLCPAGPSCDGLQDGVRLLAVFWVLGVYVSIPIRDSVFLIYVLRLSSMDFIYSVLNLPFLSKVPTLRGGPSPIFPIVFILFL